MVLYIPRTILGVPGTKDEKAERLTQFLMQSTVFDETHRYESQTEKFLLFILYVTIPAI